ncbi:SDR family oxidoreductase [Paremcibacter congregatus]|uniref:Short-chain dehydrogenase n=1 Tax=Paremcibacter congregatus TaxID=2043170 RepID=A0A2G4YR12_9PROT|nr:SDR family oxidoreductase [Paremcibacter congregatus]PHZ84761.1 short-chain dehydrogenase [Paremcibacter congregatus]QDE28953.1 glucose 1-dehydrogenase [Paremcibacter congregatus]
MNKLQDKVAIVTGASSGIGYETALLFARQGAKLIVSARRQKELDELVSKITKAGGTALAVVGDIKKEATAKALVEVAISNFGELHIAFNNAGWMGEMGPTPDVSLAGFEETIATNLTAAFLGAKFQIPAMLESGGGSIIFTSTFVGYTAGMPGMAAYAAAKSGLIGLTQALAAEFGPQKIRVNALLPGGVNTPMGRSAAETPEAMEFVKGLHALKRTAEPEEIAQSALYLASDASSFTTGTAMLVDGGVSINRT